VIILIGHDDWDTIKDYWSTNELYYTPFFSKVMKHDWFLHILIFLHFKNNEIPADRMSSDYDRLWKLRKVFDHFTNTYSTLYLPTENLAVDEVIVRYKGRVGFCRYIPKKHNRFGIKLYKLLDSKGCTCMTWLFI
jgi:hypothetical protein